MGASYHIDHHICNLIYLSTGELFLSEINNSTAFAIHSKFKNIWPGNQSQRTSVRRNELSNKAIIVSVVIAYRLSTILVLALSAFTCPAN